MASAELPVNDAVERTSQSDNTETSSKGAKEKKPKGGYFKSFVAYFELLFYAGPTWVDMTYLFVGAISAAAAGVPFPLMGIIFGELLDDLNTATCEAKEQGSAPGIQSSVNGKVLQLVYIAIASFVLIYIYVVAWAIFSRRLETRLRDRYFQNILRQDAAFFDSRQAGEISSRLNTDIQAIQSGTSEKVGICIACTSFFLTAYIVAFIKDAKLAGMLFSLIPAFCILATVGSIFTSRFSTRMSDSIAAASSIAQETLSHISVVQAFGAGPRLEAKFASRLMTAQKQGIKKTMTTAIQAGTLYFIAYSANALAFFQGSREIVASVKKDGGNVSVGRVYTVIFLLVDACVVFGSIAPLLPLLNAASASFQKLREDIELPSKIDSAAESGEKLPPDIQGAVSFHNVSFAYVSRPDQPVLKSVSFDCPAGKQTALVGLSGSGKSTIAGLTSRLYDPTEGVVRLDGHDLRDLNVKNLRSFMSLVQQEPSLLDRSILENIALGMLNSPQPEHKRFESVILGPGLSEIATKVREGEDFDTVVQSYGRDMVDLVELVRNSANLADASSFIEKLEKGYGTEVGTLGKLVSGGQRQRIALARALIRDPKILILDEATASLDSASEHRIQMAIEAIAKTRTVLAIAHRLSTVKNADKIIVMNNGKIIEQGTHFELMTLNGSYAAMIRLQNINRTRGDDYSLTSTLKDGGDAVISEKESDTEEKIALVERAPEQDAENAQAEDNSKSSEPNEVELDASKSTWKVAKTLGRMIRPHLLWLVIAFIAATMVAATFSGEALIFGNIVNKISPCNPIDRILWAGRFFGGMLFMLAILELFAYSFSWTGFGYVAEKLLYRIRVLSFRTMYEQGLDWHQAAGRTPTQLLSVITADAAAVGGFSGSIMGTFYSIGVNFLIAIILSHIVNWRIAVVCLVTVPMLLGSGIMQVRELAKFERKHAGAFSSAIGITVEAVNSFKTVSSLSIEKEIMGTFHRALKAPRKEMFLATAYTNLWLALANSTGNLVYAFAYWWGSTRMTKGQATQADFYIVIIAMLVSAQLWGQMFSLAPEVSRARAAASRILSLLDLGSVKKVDVKDSESEVSSEKGYDIESTAEAPLQSSGMRGATITFKDVSFSYPARPHIQILKNMSFTIPAGQFCGLVGPSGAGKSTIMSLVQRMYYPTGGKVEINGVDICAREGTEFRNDIAVVPQDCALFEGTIKFNVGLGAVPDHEATDAEIEEACRLANIHDTIIELPDGYNTECGPNGSRLSGGQRQRLAIARALVRKPKLLLLDESTSALDAESERLLQEGLERAARDITVIAITHRLHTVRKAGVIFVVEGGSIKEKGTHEELVATSESYRVNALQQMLGD